MSYVVQSITNKTVNTKFGPKDAFSLKANNEWFNLGFNKPKFSVGDTVDFMYEEGNYGKQVDPKTIRVLSKGTGTPNAAGGAPASDAAAGSSVRSYGPPQKVFPVPKLHGDRSIIRQNSVTNAVNVLKDKFGEDASVEDMAGLIIQLARQFEAYSSGDLDQAEGDAE